MGKLQFLKSHPAGNAKMTKRILVALSYSGIFLAWSEWSNIVWSFEILQANATVRRPSEYCWLYYIAGYSRLEVNQVISLGRFRSARKCQDDPSNQVDIAGLLFSGVFLLWSESSSIASSNYILQHYTLEGACVLHILHLIPSMKESHMSSL
jgi:hypothetical protein